MKKLLTIDDLYNFCVKNNFHNFSSADSGYRIVVQIPSTFEETEDDDLTRAGLMRLKIKVAHIGRNRNNSYISEENMKKALPSLKNRPLLGYIHQLEDGTYDFWSHNISVTQDEDGNDVVEYLESQIGSFTEDDPFLEYDEENDKTYAVAYAVVPEGYSKAADIIRAKKGTKNSCELFIDKFVYNGQEKCIELVDFFFGGSTMLGSDDKGNEIQEGMAGSRADIVDFAEDENSLCRKNEKKEGGSTLLEELLNKYNKTLEDITFEYENLSDEELTAKFAEAFDTDEDEFAEDVVDEVADIVEGIFSEEVHEAEVDNEVIETEDASGDTQVVEENSEESPEVVEENSEESPEEEPALNDSADEFESNDESDNSEEMGAETYNVTYELSFGEIEMALYELTSVYRNNDEWCYPHHVYDSYFIMYDFVGNTYYKQSYEIDESDAVSLSGEREKLYAEFLTESEKTMLDTMRGNYEAMAQRIADYEKAEMDAQKNEVLADPSYANYLESDEFVELIKNKDDYTLDEFREKAELAFAKCVKLNGQFSLHVDEVSTRKRVTNGRQKIEEKKPYGNLFDDK